MFTYLVLLRHGESEWNKENRFTGWVDIDLSTKGREEAHEAARLLKKDKFTFDLVFTSFLKRGINTLTIVLKEMGLKIPIEHSWRLNERHYGKLQGLNKTETAKKYGEKQVLLWRRSYAVRPPALIKPNPNYCGYSLKEQGLTLKEVPLAESLKDVEARFLPYWHKEIAPALKKGKKVLISAHGNSLRALVKYLDNIPPSKIMNLNIPTGIPLVYELDKNLHPIKKYYLADEDKVKKAIVLVANQGKVRN